jgi:hypothetical protein
LGLLLPLLLVFRQNREALSKSYIFWSACFFVWGSVIPVILLGSTLYSGWRHVQYIFGPLVVLGVYGLDFVRKKLPKNANLALVSVVSISLVYTLGWGVLNHPHQYIYFNVLAGSNWGENWEHDYWWLSSKQLLEFALEDSADSDNEVAVCGGRTAHVPLNMYMIPLEERSKIRLDCTGYRDSEEHVVFDYLLHNNNSLGEYSPALEGFDQVHAEVVGGEVISRVYKKRY